MSLRSVLHALPLVATLGLLPPADAAVLSFDTQLAGTSEVPANASPGTGTATVQIDTVLRTLSLQMSFIGLTGLTTASHIHCCALPGTSVGVATQVPTFAGFPLNATSGTYVQSFDMSLASSWNPAFITAQGGTPLTAFDALVANMIQGRTYLNIHTTLFAGGEIRGQLHQVPVPGTLALLGVALLGLAPVLRRRPS